MDKNEAVEVHGAAAMSISEGTSWSVAQTSQRDGPDTLGVFYEVDVHFKELTDDLDIRRCMARQGSSPKSSRVGKRDSGSGVGPQGSG